MIENLVEEAITVYMMKGDDTYEPRGLTCHR